VANALMSMKKKIKEHGLISHSQRQNYCRKYDTGFNKDRNLGWSMTKSITSAMFGILQKQGKYDIYKPAL
jgi:hypothetical protein